MTVDLISRITEKAKANNAGNPINNAINNNELIISLSVNSIKYHPKNQIYFRDLDKAMKDKLMEDMRDNGQINPIIVKKNADETYTVIAGHQRLIAARRLNWQQIKAIVIDVNEYEAEKLLIRDNLFRRHMGGMELARALDAYSSLSDNQTRKSIRQIADELGENRNTVHFYMKLNNLIPELQQLVDERKLSPTAAQVFSSMKQEEQKDLFVSLGDSLIGIKKKELEEELRQRFGEELQNAQAAKTQVENERDRLVLEIKRKDKDTDQLKNQLKNLINQSEVLSIKAMTADLSRQMSTAFSKLEVIDSLANSINLDNLENYDIETLTKIQTRFRRVAEYFCNLVNLIESSINNKSTGRAVDNVCN